MRRYAWIAALVIVLLAAGCDRAAPAAPTIAPAATPAAANTPTAAPSPTATPIPPIPTEPPPATATAEPAPLPTEAVPVSFCELVDPSLIYLNAGGLVSDWQANCVPEGEITSGGPEQGGLPEHVQINFGGLHPDSRQPGDPVLYLIPADAYREMWDGAGFPVVGEKLDDLRAWIDRRPAAVRTRGMPVLPLEEARAVNDLAVAGQYLNFGTWDGLRFVGRFGQGPNPVTNQNLTYIFQGFAGENDEIFVALFYPVSSPRLPQTSEEVSREEMNALETDPLAYLDARAAELNGLATADWQPDLAALDALVASLQYGGEEIAAELPTLEASSGKLAASAVQGVVTAPAGVNVRTGPSTAYLSLGVARFGATLPLIGRSQDGQWWVTPVAGAPDGRGWVSATYVAAANTSALPVMIPSSPPAPPALPEIPPGEPWIYFWTDRGIIDEGECTTLRWSVANITAVWVYPAGEDYTRYPVTGDGSRGVCPTQTTLYEMRVLLPDNSLTSRQVTITVNPGNSLAGTDWVLASMDGGQPLLPGAPPTLSLGFGNFAEGFGGCNAFTANYSTGANGVFAFSRTGQGAVSCGADRDAQEARYLSRLQGAGFFALLSGGELVIRDTSGVESLRFIRR